MATQTNTRLDAEVKFRLRPDLKAALEKMAAAHESSIGNIVRRAVRELIFKETKKVSKTASLPKTTGTTPRKSIDSIPSDGGSQQSTAA